LTLIFIRLYKIEERYYYLRHVCLPVFPHGTTRFSPDGNSHTLIFDYCSEKRRKTQVSLKSDKNDDCFTRRPMLFVIISRRILLRMRNVTDKNCKKNQNAYFVVNNVFRKSYHLGNNFARYGGARQVIWIRRIRFVCWITKAKDTLRICTNYCLSMEKMIMRTRLNLTFVRALFFWIIVLFYCKECTTVTNTAERYHETVCIILALKEGNMGSHNRILKSSFGLCNSSNTQKKKNCLTYGDLFFLPKYKIVQWSNM